MDLRNALNLAGVGHQHDTGTDEPWSLGRKIGLAKKRQCAIVVPRHLGSSGRQGALKTVVGTSQGSIGTPRSSASSTALLALNLVLLQSLHEQLTGLREQAARECMELQRVKLVQLAASVMLGARIASCIHGLATAAHTPAAACQDCEGMAEQVLAAVSDALQLRDQLATETQHRQQAEADAAASQAQLQQLQAASAATQSQLQEARATAAAAAAQATLDMSELQQLAQGLQQQLTALTEDRDQLQALLLQAVAVQQLQTQAAATRQDSATQTADEVVSGQHGGSGAGQAAVDNTTVAQLQAQVLAKDTCIAELQEVLQHLADGTAQHTARVSQLELQLDQAEQLRLEAEQRSADLAVQLTAAEEQAAELEQQLQAAQGEASAAERMVAMLEEQMRELKLFIRRQQDELLAAQHAAQRAQQAQHGATAAPGPLVPTREKEQAVHTSAVDVAAGILSAADTALPPWLSPSMRVTSGSLAPITLPVLPTEPATAAQQPLPSLRPSISPVIATMSAAAPKKKVSAGRVPTGADAPSRIPGCPGSADSKVKGGASTKPKSATHTTVGTAGTSTRQVSKTWKPSTALPLTAPAMHPPAHHACRSQLGARRTSDTHPDQYTLRPQVSQCSLGSVSSSGTSAALRVPKLRMDVVQEVQAAQQREEMSADQAASGYANAHSEEPHSQPGSHTASVAGSNGSQVDSQSEPQERYYFYPKLDPAEEQWYMTAIEELKPKYKAAFKKLWQEAITAKQNCEAMTSRGDRLLIQTTQHYKDREAAFLARLEELYSEVEEYRQLLTSKNQELADLYDEFDYQQNQLQELRGQAAGSG